MFVAGIFGQSIVLQSVVHNIYIHTFILTSNHMLERQLCAFSATSSPRPEMDMIGLDDPFWHLINEFGISPSSFHLSHPTLGVSWMNEEEFNSPALQGCMD